MSPQYEPMTLERLAVLLADGDEATRWRLVAESRMPSGDSVTGCITEAWSRTSTSSGVPR